MKRYLFSLICSSVLLFTSQAQELDITLHDLSEFSSDITKFTFAQSTNDDIWLTLASFGSSPYKLVRYDGETWAEVEAVPCSNCARAIAADDEGSIWLATSEGVYHQNGTQWDTIWTGGWVQNIKAKDSNHVWFKTATGLQFYNGTEVIDYSTLDGISTASTNSFLLDSEGILWFFASSLIHSFDGNSVSAYPAVFAPHKIALGIQNSVWLSSSFGDIGYFQNGIWSGNLDFEGWPSFLSYTALTIDQNGVIWVGWQGAEGGVARQSDNNLTFWPSAELGGEILIDFIFVANDNKKWVASRYHNIIAEIDDTDFLIATEDIGNKVNFNINISPNPMPKQGQISYTLDKTANVQLDILGMDGKLIQQLTNGKATQGKHAFEINTNNWHSGIYQAKLTVDGVVSSKSFVLK